MSDTVKLIIEIPKVPNNDHERWVLAHGIPLDGVKAEIEQIAKDYDKFDDYRRVRGLWIALEIVDNIGKGDKG